MSPRVFIPLPLIFLVALTIVLIPVSVAQDSPQDYVVAYCVPFPQDSPQDYVVAHNAARSIVGVGTIAWDEGVAAYAMNHASGHASDCTQLVHSGGPYGENLAWDSPDLTGRGAVNMWVGEKPYYNYNSNSCVTGEVCWQYTQVVWRNSTRLGCAKAQCLTGGTLVTCNYDPPGNYEGERPY